MVDVGFRDVVFERYYQELLRFVARTTGSQDMARDVVHDAYVRILAKREREEDAASAAAGTDARALLFHTVKNIVIDYYRRNQVRGHEDISLCEITASSEDEPEAALARRQRSEALLAAIAELPPRCREAFVLFKFDGMRQGEIAERMGISRNMVERHVMAGMLACRRCLERFDG